MLFLHLWRIVRATLGDGLVVEVLRVVGLGKEESALGQANPHIARRRLQTATMEYLAVRTGDPG